MESTEDVVEQFIGGENILRRLLKSSRSLEILSRGVAREMLEVSEG